MYEIPIEQLLQMLGLTFEEFIDKGYDDYTDEELMNLI